MIINQTSGGGGKVDNTNRLVIGIPTTIAGVTSIITTLMVGQATKIE